MKKKQKFKSAEHARMSREADKLQQEIYKRWSISSEKSKPSTKTFVPSYSYRDSDNKLPSVALSGGACSRRPDRQYTGSLVIGISTLHKSNAVPIINQEQAEEISRMRRG